MTNDNKTDTLDNDHDNDHIKDNTAMGDIKFTNAGDYIKSLEEREEFIYPGKDCQI